jgi:hypothetical protein
LYDEYRNKIEGDNGGNINVNVKGADTVFSLKAGSINPYKTPYLKPGEYKLTFSAKDVVPDSKVITLKPAENYGLNINLTPQSTTTISDFSVLPERRQDLDKVTFRFSGKVLPDVNRVHQHIRIFWGADSLVSPTNFIFTTIINSGIVKENFPEGWDESIVKKLGIGAGSKLYLRAYGESAYYYNMMDTSAISTTHLNPNGSNFTKIIIP